MAEKTFTVEGIEFVAKQQEGHIELRAGPVDRQASAFLYEGGSAELSFTAQNGELISFGGDLNANDILESMIDYAQGRASFDHSQGQEDGILHTNSGQSEALQRVTQQHTAYNAGTSTEYYPETYPTSLDDLVQQVTDIAAQISQPE